MQRSAAVDRYSNAVAAAVEAVFGERLRGVWLLGSHSYGGATEQSDVDIQACVTNATAAEIDQLADRIAHPTLPCPGAGLEFVLYDARELAAPAAPLQWLLNLNGGPSREHKRSTDPTSESWHWFVLDLVGGRRHAYTLAGAALADVLGPIDRKTQIEAMTQSYRWHKAHESGGHNQIGNAARGLMYLQTDVWGSKDDGLTWATAMNLTTRELILGAFAEALEAEGAGPF